MASEDIHELVTEFFQIRDSQPTLKSEYSVHDSFSDLIGGCLQVNSVERGKISCLLKVKAPLLNGYGGLHGGAVASVAERVAIACARTIVGKEKHLFLGELGMSYLLAAPQNAELTVDASVLRSGRNVSVFAINFLLKESNQLVYVARATLYHIPSPRL